MLTPKITKCKECADIIPLLEEINCKVFDMSQRLYNNIVFSLNLYIDYMAILDLLNYKRILEYKLINPDYACEFSVSQIAGKVKLITLGCKTKCPCVSGPTLTTTTTAVQSFAYNVDFHYCNTCQFAIQGTINNVSALTVGEWYHDIVTGHNIFVSSFIGNSVVSDRNIINASQTSACFNIMCTTTTTSTIPPTTTTTTTCNVYSYTVNNFTCSDCSPSGTGGTINNYNLLTVGKYYYLPSVERRILIVAFNGCNVGLGENILDSTKKNTCAEVVCVPTTTTSTTL
jgi:hypothetical protein